jgi:hypothetical protein
VGAGFKHHVSTEDILRQMNDGIAASYTGVMTTTATKLIAITS